MGAGDKDKAEALLRERFGYDDAKLQRIGPKEAKLRIHLHREQHELGQAQLAPACRLDDGDAKVPSGLGDNAGLTHADARGE